MYLAFISHHILSILIFFPIFFGLSLFLFPKSKNPNLVLTLTLGALILEFIFSLHLVRYFFPHSYDFQFTGASAWLPQQTGIHYLVGVDGFSLYFVLLTTILFPIIFLSVFQSIKTHLRAFCALFLFLQGSLIGAFVSLDLFLFYFFWEASLIPLYFMIGFWGGRDRFYATIKFFVYGVAGSLLMLVAFIYLYALTPTVLNYYSANILDIYKVASTLPFTTQALLFAAIALAFGIKIPMFPFYTWLPDTYMQSPIMYPMISGVVLKLAVYGLVRFCVCLLPEPAAHYSNLLLILGLIGIFYGALIAWQQTHLRRIMAFSSLSHMGFIAVGIFALNGIGLQGALYQSFNHAITACAFFILFQFLESHYKTLEIEKLGGLAKNFPWFGFFFGIIAMSSVALPSTGSFLGEWLILLGVFARSNTMGFIAAFAVVFGAVYVLWFTYKVIFGPAKHSASLQIKGLNKIQVFQLSVLSIAIFVLGFGSSKIFESSKQTITHMEQTLLTKVPYKVNFTSQATVSPQSGKPL